MKKILSSIFMLAASISVASANLFITTDPGESGESMDIALNEGYVAVGLLKNGKLLVDGPNGIEVVVGEDGVPQVEGAEFFSAANIEEVPAARQPEVRAALMDFLERLNPLVGVEGSNVTEADVMEVAVFLATFGLPPFDPATGTFVETTTADDAQAALDIADREGDLPLDQDRPETPESIDEPAPAPPVRPRPSPPVTTPPVDNNDSYFGPGT